MTKKRLSCLQLVLRVFIFGGFASALLAPFIQTLFNSVQTDEVSRSEISGALLPEGWDAQKVKSYGVSFDTRRDWPGSNVLNQLKLVPSNSKYTLFLWRQIKKTGIPGTDISSCFTALSDPKPNGIIGNPFRSYGFVLDNYNSNLGKDGTFNSFEILSAGAWDIEGGTSGIYLFLRDLYLGLEKDSRCNEVQFLIYDKRALIELVQ